MALKRAGLAKEWDAEHTRPPDERGWGMSGATLTDNELKIQIEGNERKASRSGYVLIAGLLIEVASASAKSEKELIDFRRPRRELMTAQNRSSLIDKLTPFAGTQFDVGFGSGGEQIHFVWDLEEVLAAAGWVQLPWGVHAVGTLTNMRNLRPLAGAVHAQNVEIQLEPSWRQSTLPVAEALIDALNEVGISASETPYNFENTNTQAIHILIGAKA